MSDQYVGEIRMFGGTYAPQDWAFCDGQILPISEFDVLFSLIGTTYGGDGVNTFALPDLRGRLPVHAGVHQNQYSFAPGQSGGSELETLAGYQLPAHNHAVAASASDGTTGSPAGAYPAHVPGGTTRYTTGGSPVAMAGNLVGPAGGGQPHLNLSPFLGVNFIIALWGIYPSPQ